MKILNLFAGIGGNRKLWGDSYDITAVELDPQIAKIYASLYPKDKIIVGDAYSYLEDHYLEYDLIWASPPCPTHSKNQCRPSNRNKLPDLRLYSIILFLQSFYKGIYVVENVVPYYLPLIKPSAKVDRHYYWSNKRINSKNEGFMAFTSPNYIGKDGKSHNGGLSDLTLEELSQLHNLDLSIFQNYVGLDKRKILRNMVKGDVGLYIFQQITR